MNVTKDFSIDKLNTNNYDIWKFKIQLYLEKEDLFEVLVDNPPNPITTEWQKKCKKAKAIINLSIDDSQIIHVRNKETAKECWDALKSVHEHSTLSSKLFLLRKLYSIKLPEKGNMIEHITKIYEIRDKLAAIGEQIKDHHLAALMLCSLPSSYDPLITALEVLSDDELTSEFIKNKLIDEYSKREINSSEKNDIDTALKVKSKQQYDSKFCKYCKKSSHEISECWFLKNKNKEKNKRFYNNNKNQHHQQRSAMCSQDSKDATRPHFSNNEKGKHNDKNFTFYVGNNSKNLWIIDSGSSTHICNDREKFHDFCENDSSVTVANGYELKSLGYGSVKLNTVTSSNSNATVTLKNVLYVPEIESNLISVKRATENGCVAIFEKQYCKIVNNGDTCLEGTINNNLYECKINNVNTHTVNFVDVCNNKNCIDLWHRKLGHRNVNHIRELVTKNMATGIILNDCKHNNECETCIMSKLADKPYPKSVNYRASKPIELIYTDLCGPMQTPTIGGKYYFLTFVDDYSRFTVIYLLRHKSEVFSKFKEYIALTSNKFGRKVQAVRSDNGGEYTSSELSEYLKNKGIEHQFTVPYSAPQNGVAERKNRTLVEMTRCLLKDANLPNSFWGEAINTANYLQNRLPTSSCDLTPYEKWTGRKPDLSNIKTFGCRAYAYVQKVHRRKLDSTAKEGIFVGYDYRSKGYRICTGGKNIIISRNVKFVENKPQRIVNKNSLNENNDIVSNASDSNKNKQIIVLSDENSDDIADDTQTQAGGSNNSNYGRLVPRRSERINRGVPPDRFAFMTNSRIKEPSSWEEIVKMENNFEREKWIEATRDEMNSLYENNTWELVDVTPGTKVIGCKWAFKAKYNSNGNIEKYKARLVAKGFSQKYGIDYDETFAPVASHTTIRSFLAMALHKNLQLRHIDIKTAFLHGELKEEVYMRQPDGYIVRGQENKVCKLKKALYGLKQAARAWNIKISDTLTKLGFTQSSADKCLFKLKNNDKTIYVIVYVDDILIAGEEHDIKMLVDKLKMEYPVTDLGEARQYLGINITRPNKETLKLDQIHKINELVRKFHLEDCRPTDTPMEPGFIKLNDNEKLLSDNTKYRQAVGALLYISTVTRPDISVAVNILSRRNENPREKDWEAVKRTIRYLKSTINYQLVFTNTENPVLRVYADADWANDPHDRKSTTGNLFLLGRNPISWCSKRQNCIAMSSAEAEYISAATAAQEIKWIINLLEDLDLKQTLPISLLEDNQSCIKMANSEKFYSKTKHIDLRYHLIRNLVQENIITLKYIETKRQLADVLTKALPRPDFTKFRDMLFAKD